MLRHASIRRVAGLLGLVVLLVGGSGGVAGADTELASWGLTGPRSLRDRQGLPGVACRYVETSGILDTLRVRPPKVRARNVSASRDRQTVSWAIRVDYWDVNEFWATASTAGPWKATAWDDQVAAFSARTIDAPIGMGGRYRVVVVIRWYRGGALEGRSLRLVDWYRRVDR